MGLEIDGGENLFIRLLSTVQPILANFDDIFQGASKDCYLSIVLEK